MELEHKFYCSIRVPPPLPAALEEGTGPVPPRLSKQQKNGASFTAYTVLVEEGGFEPPKLTQQIYSLPPLATRELLHMQLYGRMELVDGFEPPTC